VNPLRLAVVGGGLTGLAAAYRLLELSAAATDRPCEVTLFEASPHSGGVIGTNRIQGYLAELGADMFITNRPWAISLVRRLGLESRVISTEPTYRRSLVLRKGRPVEVPDGFQLLSPVQAWPVLKSSIFSPWGKLRMGLEYLLPSRKETGDESLAHFVRRRFGNEALERLIQPLVGGIYTADPEKLSLQATLPRFLDMEREHGSLIRALRSQKKTGPAEAASGARYGLFVSFPDGIAELLNALTSQISAKGQIQFGTTITQVLKRETGFLLTLGNGTEQEFDGVVLAMPSYRAAALVRGFAESLATALDQIEYASAAIVVTGHKLADITHPMDAYGLVVPEIEKRKVLAVSFTSRKFPGRAPEGCVMLRTFVGGAMHPELLEQTDDQILNMVREELAEIFGVRWNPDFTRVQRWNKSMAQYHVGHLERVATIERELSAYPSLRVAGNAYHGVGIPDCIHSGETAAEAVWKNLEK